MKPCQILGVLDNGIDSLTPTTLAILQQADVIIGATRTLRLFESHIKYAEKKDLTGRLKNVPDWIQVAQKNNKKIVILATGDPLCHGIAHYLIKKLGQEAIEVSPNVSTITLAFSKFKMVWQDAKIISIHSKDTGEWQHDSDHNHGLYPLRQALLYENKLAILTSPENTPARIARLLMTAGLQTEFEIFIAQDLLMNSEFLIQNQSIEFIAQHSFNGNNVVILQRKQPCKTAVIFGLADECFKQRKPDKGLITK
ncbi:MAG: precorrin-6y C5,15-methyltransferase (decarboxylating) subunit CbiE, partial [Methylococcales bacterium]|nr:precorrin-6y C5,15-methyltransferase (decarboxylating) subunit CbiE [Methylococcales bacterium]